MGQFKPMVKMMTTEPTVELKLKSGGSVKKMQSGGMPSPSAMPSRGGSAALGAPMKPSIATRRRAMMAMPSGGAPAGPVGMAGRMMKEGGETKKEHAAEMKKMMGTEAKLKKHASMPASKAHRGLKTGGVVMGEGGFKKGGTIKTVVGKTTKMETTKTDRSPAKTGVVKMGNSGGFARGGAVAGGESYPGKEGYNPYKGGGKVKKFASGGESYPGKEGYNPYKQGGSIRSAGMTTRLGSPSQEFSGSTSGGESFPGKEGYNPYGTGGVAKANAGGFKKGGSAKKAFATGGVVDSGRPVAMPQGSKTPPSAVSINRLAGTYKKGGGVKAKAGGSC